MRGRGARCFVRDARELEQCRVQAKLRACPHCGRDGTLNAHGVVKGYADTGAYRVPRGQRFFCSNRHRRPGCGRTFSVLLAHVLPRFVVSTATLWSLWQAVTAGLSRKRAIEGLARMTLQSGYRLWGLLLRAQTRLRTSLCSLGPPPESLSAEPMSQLFAHFLLRLPGPCDALSNFQFELQRPLLT